MENEFVGLDNLGTMIDRLMKLCEENKREARSV
ncbi:MAG: hypothetical protein Pg6B_10530 [Candidatus Azobacteroides pseudotrichonymphae]|nr:MAG: hypothetical protein Pg6B_10530 [Candidatus Azobacteroides pseudotrichonymphae]